MAYGLATAFSLLPVSLQTLRKEAFEGKDITMEQYDELQKMGKTQEEKELATQQEEELDTESMVSQRIVQLAKANVPQALVSLMNSDPTEQTKNILLTAMLRMATEPSVRGIMIQQGVLSTVIKVEKGLTPSDTSKNNLQKARFTIAKLLITTNPSLLQTSQRLGSISPLLQLVHDHTSTDLQTFEALLSLTNLGSLDDETKNKIISSKGLSILSYAMFSEHNMVRRADGDNVQFGLTPRNAASLGARGQT